jgi:glutaredoxin
MRPARDHDTALAPRAALRPAVVLAALAVAVLAAGCNDQGAPSLHALVDKVSHAASSAGAESGVEQAAARGVEILDESATMRMYYQFVDDSGMVRFVERLADVPEQWRDRVGFVEMAVAPPLSPMDAQRTRNQQYASSARSAAARKVGYSKGDATPRRDAPEILVYYADWCGACKLMKRHLDRKGIDYELRDIDIPEILDELVGKTGARAIPVIDVEGRVLRGYNADALDELLSETT